LLFSEQLDVVLWPDDEIMEKQQEEAATKPQEASLRLASGVWCRPSYSYTAMKTNIPLNF
jgi:hypothetical protein